MKPFDSSTKLESNTEYRFVGGALRVCLADTVDLKKHHRYGGAL